LADVFVDRANFLWPLKIMNSFAPAKSAEKKWHYEREEGLFIEWTTHLLTGVAAGYAATNDWKGALVGGVVAYRTTVLFYFLADKPHFRASDVDPFLDFRRDHWPCVVSLLERISCIGGRPDCPYLG